MSRQSPDKPKRRAPSESATDDRQDADWGFESDDDDLGTEKKLGLVLVVCLLAGFSFVLYQKYRILQQEATQAEPEQPAGGDPAGEDTQQPVVVSEGGPTPAASSPFYESPSEPTPTSAEGDQWSLTSEKSPLPSLTDSAPSLVSNQQFADEFNPFAIGPDVVSSEPEAAPGPTDVPTVAWDDNPLSPASSAEEPAPFDWEDASASNAAAASDGGLGEPSPFPAPEPTLADVPLQSQEPEPVDEPPMFDFGAPSEPESQTTAERPSFVLDPAPAEPQPQSLPALESALPPARSASSRKALPETAAEFDSFSVAETTTSPAGHAPPPEPESAPFPAPDAADDWGSPEPAPVKTSESLEWPFSESEETAPPTTQWPPPPQHEEPRPADGDPAVIFEPVATPVPAESADVRQTPSLHTNPTNPFAGAAAEQQVVTSLVSPHAVVGEREMVVTQSDSFWSISQREYGTSRYFTALARYNGDRVPQPERLRSGMTIRIPPPEVLEAKFPELFQDRKTRKVTITPTGGSTVTVAETAPSGLFFDERRLPQYRVGQRDTLSTIAQQHLGRAARWTEIYKLNRDQLNSPSTLTIGMVLKLPPDTSGTIVRPAHDFSR